jgi:hypothetical protein
MCAFDDLEDYINSFPKQFNAKKREMLKLLGEAKKSRKRKRPLPTLERVKELLEYQSISGEFVWRTSGERAGWIDGQYRRIKIDNVCILAHRLTWFWNYGVWPHNGMDHINGQCLDNRLENLRDATSSVSAFNRGRPRNNTSGIVGVERAGGKWRARLGVNGSRIELGLFDNVRDAEAARRKAERKYFPGIKRWAA